MKDKKLQVFVSSTFIDLIEERQAAVEAILSSGHIPAGMELFSAGDETQMTVIKRWIDESDVYLLILGGRYGSIDRKTNKSYTQLEYEYAVETNKPLFSIIQNQSALDEKVKKFGIEVFEQENPKELQAFRSLVMRNLIKFWDDKKDIKIAIHETLSEFYYRKDLKGWIRGDKSIDTGILAEEIARLTKENSELRELIDKTQNTNQFVGGLSYIDLEKMLVKEKFKGKIKGLMDDSNLLEGFLFLADELTVGIYNPSNEEKDLLKKLTKYRIVDEIGDANTFVFKMSEQGHAFYLNKLASNFIE